MCSKHTVEKIGGTSMTQFGDVMKNVIIGNRKADELYNRVFIVSAYGGVTDLLLEHKKSGEPGVYDLFEKGHLLFFRQTYAAILRGLQAPPRLIYPPRGSKSSPTRRTLGRRRRNHNP